MDWGRYVLIESEPINHSERDRKRKSFPREVIHGGFRAGGGGLKGVTTFKVKEKTTVIMAVPLVWYLGFR